LNSGLVSFMKRRDVMMKDPLRPRGPWVRAAGIGLAISLALLSGCMFRRLEKNLERRNQYAVLHGNVSADHATTQAIIVVAYGGEAGSEYVVDNFVLAWPGPYSFLLPPGRYRLAAFEDVGGDLQYHPGIDPVVLWNDGAAIDAIAGETRSGLDMMLNRDSDQRMPFAFDLTHVAARGVRELPDFHLGEVTSIDDARFSYDNAELGLWQPVDFVFNVGAGVYFLEPYDPDKIPVLFVHGAVGHPGIWADLIERLDREHFQPWLVYYPTAARLDMAAEALDRWIQYLFAVHRFPRLVVVAHSMGGLVARAFINRVLAASDGGAAKGLRTFITLSTPWNGHTAAARGVEKAPVVAPSWYDMAPGSPFLQSLLAAPLPPPVEYDLLFTYGDASILLDGSNDGSVTVASQLEPRAQAQAHKIYGINSGHGAVLRSPEAAAIVNRYLAQALE